MTPAPPTSPQASASGDAPLKIDRRGALATLALDRPALHNAFDDALIAALTEALRALGTDPSVRAVVLAGNGPSFSAGADLGWMRRMALAPETENRADAEKLATLMRALDELPKPTIARVHGAAFGGGVGLVACCDIAIGVPEAKFGLTETRLGLVPAAISPFVIAAIGARQARRWFQSAEIFDAAEALRIGLLHAVVPAEELDAVVRRQCELLLKVGPTAIAEAKALVRRVSAGGHDASTLDRDNAALIAQLRVSPEGQEGLSAFLDKRKPRWDN